MPVWSSGCTTTYGTVDQAWEYWVTDGYTTSSTEIAWTSWNNGYIVVGTRESTPEELDRRAARMEEARLEEEKRRKKLQEAEARAESLLQEHLTQEQADMLARMREFIVVGSKGNRYSIRRGRAQNVFKLDEQGRKVTQLCAHPSEFVPDPDTMLAQKLALEADEDFFLGIANARQMIPS